MEGFSLVDRDFIFCFDYFGGFMKSVSCILFSVILGFGPFSLAKTHDMNSTLSSATNEEKNDLAKLLAQVTMVPTKEKQNGKMLFKVTKVEKDSMWERMGWKVGDLVVQ